MQSSFKSLDFDGKILGKADKSKANWKGRIPMNDFHINAFFAIFTSLFREISIKKVKIS